MTDKTNIIQQVTYMAIDIAKKNHDVLIQHSNGKRQYLKITNSLDGYNRLMDIIGDKAPAIKLSIIC